MSIATRAPRGPETDGARPSADPDAIAAHLEDAAHYPGGHAIAIAFPRTEADVARLLRTHRAVLPVGAQSSLTGGATPMGDLLLSTARLDAIESVSRDRARVQAGVTLDALQHALASAGAWYPPVPTFTGATAGGIVATNAAGAATFKHGATRAWVEALTVVLASGDVLDVERGQARAEDGRLSIETPRGPLHVDVPRYTMPAVAKCSAGYFAAPEMDLVDLFVGAEGTLGVITAVTLRAAAPPPATALVLVPCTSDEQLLGLAADLRRASTETWRTGDPRGIDAAALEMLDVRSLAILREDGADRKHGVDLPPAATGALIVHLELPAGTGGGAAFDEIGRALDASAPDTPIVRLCRRLAADGLLEATAIAVPGDARRAAQILAVREAVPSGVNARVARAKAAVDAAIEKTAADMIVPFERFAGMWRAYRDGFERRGLDYAIWGHVSDGNVHPNVIPRTLDDVRAGKEAVLEFGREAARLGGSPLAEHGVGRNPVKQALLRQLYGDDGLRDMRRVKAALDPEWRVAPGVIVPK